MYNAKGQRLLIAFGNDVMTRYVYSSSTVRLLRQKSEKFTYSQAGNKHTYTPQSGTKRQDDSFNFDLVGNIMKILHRTSDCGISGGILGNDGLDRMFEYDPLYRVIYADGRESDTQNQNDYLYTDAPNPGTPNSNNVRAYTRKYSFDKLGNIQQLKQLGTNGFTRNFVYHTGKNTLQKIETAAVELIEDFTYDTCGNQLTAGTTRNYVWNAANQLITYKNQIGSNDPTIFAQYDYSGMNRVSKMVKTGSAGSPIYERTIYIDGVFEYHILENGTTYEKNYVHLMDDTSRIATVRIGDQFPDDIADSVTYNLEDQIGSNSIRLNTSGGIIDKEEYYPFGDSSLRTFSKKRYRYVGKEKDLESGLYYYGARYYAAWTCRFISVDPAREQRAWLTPYNYVQNNPINLTDPTGALDDGGGDEPKGGGTQQNGNGQEQNETTKKTEVHKNAYYKSDGTFLGYGTGTDNEVYIADSATKNKDGTLTFENAVKVDNITHTEFATSANIIKHESSGDKEESLWIAHASNNASGLKDVGGKHTSMYSQLMDSNYSTTPSSARTPLKTSDSSSAANNARAAVIDVMTGGADPSGGAVLWDGTDFLAWGTSHNKFKEYTSITIASSLLVSYIAAQQAKWGSTVPYGEKRYDLPHSVFTSGATSARPNGLGGYVFNGFYKKGSGQYYDLRAIGQQGLSIFWSISSKL